MKTVGDDGYGRLGELDVTHGPVETPALFPVVNMIGGTTKKSGGVWRRMRNKLISKFRVTPADAGEFDQTLIWKRLYDALGVTEDSPATAVWDGRLGAFCPADINIPDGREETNLEIYALRAESESR